MATDLSMLEALANSKYKTMTVTELLEFAKRLESGKYTVNDILIMETIHLYNLPKEQQEEFLEILRDMFRECYTSAKGEHNE
jgi:hypothetical protein